MAFINPITTSLQSPTVTGPVTGVLDTSALTGDFTLRIVFPALAAGKKAKFIIEDTANVTAFSDALPVAVFDLIGSITTASPLQFDVRKYQIPSIRVGVANAKLRVNLLSFDAGANPSVNCYLEQTS